MKIQKKLISSYIQKVLAWNPATLLIVVLMMCLKVICITANARAKHVKINMTCAREPRFLHESNCVRDIDHLNETLEGMPITSKKEAKQKEGAPEEKEVSHQRARKSSC